MRSLGKTLVSLAFLLAVFALLGWLLVKNWDLARNKDGGEEARLGLCLEAARPLPPGTRIAADGDLRERLCRRGPKVTKSKAVGHYVKTQIEMGDQLDLANLQAVLPDPFGQVRVVIKVPDGRALRLFKGDRLLLVRSVKDGEEREIIPSLHQNFAPEGLEVIGLPPGTKEGETSQLIIVAVPAGRVAEAVRLSQGDWSPVLLNADRPCRGRATCPKHSARPANPS